MRKPLTRAVVRALNMAGRQTSLRQIARDAGVTQPTLTQLRLGDFQATPALAAKLADVFGRWGAEYQKLAQTIRAAARTVPRATRRGRR